MRIIGISGKAGHGKDTVGEILRAEFEVKGKSVLVTHYGDLVKYVATAFFGWDGNKDEEGRDLLQWVGTDVVRTKVPDYWVNFICQMLQMFPKHWDYVLIPDVRFPNEIDVPRSMGFDYVHLRVVRPNYQSLLTEEQQQHPSEVALDAVIPDAVIANDADLATLRAHAIVFARMFDTPDPMAEHQSLMKECYT